MMYFILSWRNLWRNKRRTLIVVASVFFAVIFSCVMRSGQLGSYAYMIHSSAKLFTGYLQVQGEGYWENRSIDKSIHLSDDKRAAISGITHVTNYTLRLEAFALASEGNKTKVAQVIGIDPGLENTMTGLKSRVIAGEYLTTKSQGILLSEGLAKILDLQTGDSLALLGQGYHGQTAAALLNIEGIVKLPFEEMNNRLLFLSLPMAQSVYATENRITSMAIMIENVNYLDEVLPQVEGMLDEKSVTMTWDEMMPDLVQNIQVDNASGMIMISILYIVIAFGVFGTVMMMISERLREFGILVSVGMKKIRLIFVSLLETILVSFLGVLVGIAGSIPVIYYLHNNPIYFSGESARMFETMGIEPVMMFSTESLILIYQALVVLVIALATAVYPVLFIRRLQPAEAIRK
jgi:ABC-type lipoprotein release transport system permease subunit